MGVLTWMGDGRPHCTYVWCVGKGGQSGHHSEYSLQILDEHVRSNQPDGVARTVAVHSRYLLNSSHDSSPPIHSPSHNSLVPLSLSLSLSHGGDVVDPEHRRPGALRAATQVQR
jgi:hypothetical protein